MIRISIAIIEERRKRNCRIINIDSNDIIFLTFHFSNFLYATINEILKYCLAKYRDIYYAKYILS